MTRALALLACAALLGGCAELVRWPDRMSQRPRAQRPEPPADGHYVVKPGDTVYSIAFRHQLDFRELAVWNDIGPEYLIRPGQVVRLGPPPVGAGSAASSSIQTRALARPDGPVIVAAAEPAVPAVAPAWQWPTRGPIVQGYGDGSGKGMDIGGEFGQSVVAAAPGKVVYSGAALKGYGELIIIKHDDVHLSAYGYNRRRLVGEGVTVAAGQPIAELGFGPEQKPMLHFEVRRRGRPIDPASVLPTR